MTRIKNRVSAHRASDFCWVLVGDEDDTPNYLLYAQALADDWWELVLAQMADEDAANGIFCLEVSIFNNKMYSKGGAGLRTSLEYMAKDLAKDLVAIDDPTDFQEVFGGTIVSFGAEDQSWH